MLSVAIISKDSDDNQYIPPHPRFGPEFGFCDMTLLIQREGSAISEVIYLTHVVSHKRERFDRWAWVMLMGWISCNVSYSR